RVRSLMIVSALLPCAPLPSTYVPGQMRTVSPGRAASTADWMVRNGPFEQTLSALGRPDAWVLDAKPATTNTATDRMPSCLLIVASDRPTRTEQTARYRRAAGHHKAPTPVNGRKNRRRQRTSVQ